MVQGHEEESFLQEPVSKPATGAVRANPNARRPIGLTLNAHAVTTTYEENEPLTLGDSEV